MSSRITVVNDLINLRGSIGQLSSALQRFEWDFDGEPVKLQEHHVEAVLKRYLTGKITGSVVHDWANLIECRDDIDYDRVVEVVHILANPVLSEKLSKEFATQLIGVLNGA